MLLYGGRAQACITYFSLYMSADSLNGFIEDMLPFFYGKRVVYVDVGAYTGDVFKAVCESSLGVKESYLFEPNPINFEKLQGTLEKLKRKNVFLYNWALSDSEGEVTLSLMSDLSKVTERDGLVDNVKYAKAKCVRLDSVVEGITGKHVSILKIDVEGFEMSVLAGAAKTFDEQAVDVIYIEAGYDPDNTQQCYYRKIEDYFNSKGYYLYKIYEQKNNWMADSPFLRRVNLAFMSKSFSNNHPYKIVKELYAKDQALQAESKRAKELDALLAERDKQLEAESKQRDELKAQLEESALKLANAEKSVKELSSKFEESEALLQLEEERGNGFEAKLDECEQRLHAEGLKSGELASRLAVLERELQLYQNESQRVEQVSATILEALNTRDFVALQELSGQCKRLDEDCARLKSEVVALRQTRERLKSKNALTETKLQTMEEQCESLTRSYRYFYRGMIQLQASNSDFKTRIRGMQASRKWRFANLVARGLSSPGGFFRFPFGVLKLVTAPRCDTEGIDGLDLPEFSRFFDERMVPISTSWDYYVFGLPIAEAVYEIRNLQDPKRFQPVVEVYQENDQSWVQASYEQDHKFYLRLKGGDPSTGCLKLRMRNGIKAVVNMKFVQRDQHSPVTSPPQPDEPIRKQDKNAIWNANELIESGKVFEGLKYASERAAGFSRKAILLLEANAHHGDENKWLDYLNRYIGQFGIEPLYLEKSKADRFMRIACRAPSASVKGPLISVIMPAFNAETYIERSVTSILNQTWANVELIVVDDVSQDRTYDILRSIAAKDKRLRVYRNVKNVGPYAAKNLALGVAKGAFITGHDADDWAHPRRLENQVNVMLSNPRIKAVLARMLRMRSDGSLVSFSKLGKFSDDGVLRIASISCMFERGFLLEKLGGWDGVRFGADSELIGRCEAVYSDQIENARQLSMLCLDAEGSLTNHPEMGVSKKTGLSPIRLEYRDHWKAWHKELNSDACRIHRFDERRHFDAPAEVIVPVEDILLNMRQFAR